MRGLFVTFEGIDRSGKTTQARLLTEALGDDALGVREPGGTEVGERIRQVLLETGGSISPEPEMYLFLAARAELVQRVIEPALAGDRVVVADRYHDSTLAYQGGARRLPTSWPDTFPRPNVTFLLDLEPEAGLERHRLAGRAADRLEAEPIDFHQRVAAAYRELASAEPARFVRVDASQEEQVVHEQVLARVTQLLSGRGEQAAQHGHAGVATSS
jgi:dTMP kinase